MSAPVLPHGSAADAPVAATPSPARPPIGTGGTARTGVALLLVAGTVGWRRGEYFAGSIDPVVAGKGLISLLALAGAFLLASAAGPARRRLGTGSLWFLAVLLGCSLLGALTSGRLLPGAVVSARVAVLAATVFFLLRAGTLLQFSTALARACGLIGSVAAVTGLPAAAATGRLAGGLPPLAPNELALLAGVVVVHVTWRAVLGDVGPGRAVAALLALGVIWQTGSRTGLLMLVVGLLVVAAHVRRARVGLVVSGLLLAALGVLAVVTTGAVAGFAERDGAGVSTLHSRFIAWRASLTWADSAWQQVFGGGLSVKIIRVQGQLWDTQPLDSSWVSALVQTGVLGLLVAACWAAWVLRGAWRAPRPHRALFLGLLVFLLGRSVLESGLFDATPAFLAFVAVSLLAEGGSRERLAAELRSSAGDGPAL
ncbi:O-antigen ligase family protein [Modestobacter sp. URMC 112]